MSAVHLPELQALLATEAVATPRPRVPHRCLTFLLHDEPYGLDVLDVQEIRAHVPPTRLLGAPPFVLGVLDLRGRIVPIFDLRAYLAPQEAAPRAGAIVIVLDLGGFNVGVVADSVSDVTALPPGQLKPAPPLVDGRGTRHVLGLAAIDGAPEPLLTVIEMRTLLADAGITPRTQPSRARRSN